MQKIDPSQTLDWQATLGQEKQQPYFQKTLARVQAARQAGVTIMVAIPCLSAVRSNTACFAGKTNNWFS